MGRQTPICCRDLLPFVTCFTVVYVVKARYSGTRSQYPTGTTQKKRVPSPEGLDTLSSAYWLDVVALLVCDAGCEGFYCPYFIAHCAIGRVAILCT